MRVMRRSLARAVFSVVAVYPHQRRFGLCLPFCICAATEQEQRLHHMAGAAVINCKLNESLQIDLCTQSIQGGGEKRKRAEVAFKEENPWER